MSISAADNLAINNFREYLRIPSVHPNIDYQPCIEFLKRQATDLNLPVKVYEVVVNKPIVVLTWQGTQPELPAIMLNSHMDVMPVYEASWTHKPFDAHMDAEGNIFARGAQDMKCVGIQYLEAIRRLKQRNITLKRTLHITFVPDEEIGGEDGMAAFVRSKHFEELNIGFAMDESMPSATEEMILFYGEKTLWQIHVHCTGQAGHGSAMFNNTPGDKFRYIINKFLDLRDQEKSKLVNNSLLKHGDVTSVNLTKIYGGVQTNVIPERLTAVFDVRIALSVDIVQFERMLNQWCTEAGPGVNIEFEQKQAHVPSTTRDGNPYWQALTAALDKLNIKYRPVICIGATDMRKIRAVGIPAVGFTPANNTRLLLHDHDEYLNKDIFLEGIRIFTETIPAIANV
ncbi:uncharacterized protein CBL_10259 [Carabus blaptoides fortunei]